MAGVPPGPVLVTGGTGRIGRVLVADLLERGYTIRATRSRVRPTDSPRGIDWRTFDFDGPGDVDELLRGCSAVFHLGAEIGDMSRMERVNVDATRRLAEAAERAGIGAFCYVSTVAIYGSGRERRMDEDATVLTTTRDVRSEYWALAYVRAYGRTKLKGEASIRTVAEAVRYTIFRPTVVVSVDDIIAIRSWSWVKRTLASHRHAHHVYVRDVSDAMIWAIERSLGGVAPPGNVETYNLSEDDFAFPHHFDFLRQARAVSPDRRFAVVNAPGIFDWLHDALRFRVVSIRNPLWRMRFPNDRLRRAGYRFRFGMAEAHRAALEVLAAEAEGTRRAPPDRARRRVAAEPALDDGRRRTLRGPAPRGP